MATSTELLRAAEHMRNMADDLRARGMHATPRSIRDTADIMVSEAHRLQTIETRQPESYCSDAVGRYIAVQPKRVPFAVLRRAYEMLDIMPLPSVRWMERHGDKSERSYAKRVREDFAKAVAEEM